MRTQQSGLGQRVPARKSAVETQDFDLEEDEQYYVTRPHTSARRYEGAPEQVIRQGNRTYTIHHGAPPPAQPYRSVEEEQRPRRHVHWLVYSGIALFAIIAIWQGLNALGYWWQTKLDDWTYGKNRVYTTDAVVGHNDSAQNPSHFIAVNDQGNIYVIELQGGDTSKAHIYNITTIEGNTNNPPVMLFFQHLTRSGRVDMIVQIGDQGSAFDINLFNNGTSFVANLTK